MAFLETKETLSEAFVIEARDLDHALALWGAWLIGTFATGNDG